MKKSRRLLLCISALAFLLGCVLVMTAFLMIGFDFSQLDTNKMTQKEQLIEGAFSDIEITVLEQDVRVVASPDGVCRISYYDNERVPVDIEVKDGVLRIKQGDSRNWLDFVNIVNTGEKEVTLYLPTGSYGSITVKGSSSDIELARELCFERLVADVSTGDIESYAELREGASVDGSTGDMHLENVIGGSITVECSSGDITLQHCRAEEVILSVSSGDIELKEVVLSGALRVESSTGEVEFSRIDAKEIEIEVSTGDVEGTLLSGKVFEAKAGTGRVRIPQSDAAGGPCKITTSTGDIDIEYAD